MIDEYYVLDKDKEVDNMKENRCIKNLLRLINLLQENSTNINSIDNTCSRPFLGNNLNNTIYNTRPISIYNKNNELLTITTDSGDTSFFRIENINNNCCTLRGIINNNGVYTSTNNFITIKINCICVIRCYPDVQISNL